MNLWSVSLRNLRIRAMSSTLTIVSIAVGTMLLAGLWMLSEQADKRYKTSFKGFGAVVGPKEGSPLSLVLSSVYNLGFEPGLVSLDVYKELHSGRLARRWGVRYAIPQARGDSFANFPIIGTTDEMFTKFHRDAIKEEGETARDTKRIPILLEFTAGKRWTFDHDDLLAFAERREAIARGEKVELFPDAKDDAATAGHSHSNGATHSHGAVIPVAYRRAVIGAAVAKKLGAGVGFTFVPTHGKKDEVGAHIHEEARCEVVGVLAPTYTPLDRSIFIPLCTFLSIDEHQDTTPNQDPNKTYVSSIVVSTRARLGPENLRAAFQKRSDAQVAVPRFEIPELLKIIGDVTKMIDVISWMVLVVAAIAILVALYNTMNERRREIAIMRSLGARRGQIARIILQEALLISVVGAVLGVVSAHVAAFFLSDLVAEKTSVPLDWTAFSTQELILILGVGVVGSFAGLLPAIKGSMTQVADNLTPTS